MCRTCVGICTVYIYIYVDAARIRRRLAPTRSQHAIVSTQGFNLTRLRETWLSTNNLTTKFQAPFREVGGLELFGRTMLWLFFAFACRFICVL